ncbi:MAG: nucleotidyltransferase domain-containing protein [Kofleriaceae bacterium]
MDEASLIAELRRAHAAHTIILYGSRARGDATADSDIDVATFADVATMTRDARPWVGLYLDGFVYPTEVATAEPLDPDLLKFVGARVLVDDRGLAGPLLARLTALDREPPPPAAADHRQMLRVWSRKMLSRIQRGDVEAHYRRHWLLYQLLEDYFTLRGERYRGPKLALAGLLRDRPATFAAFERALAPDAPHAALEALVDVVAGDP